LPLGRRSREDRRSWRTHRFPAMNFEKLSFENLVQALASDAPTPGGGPAAALAGAMGASLAEMVAALTLAKEKYAASHDVVRPIGEEAFRLRERMSPPP